MRYNDMSQCQETLHLEGTDNSSILRPISSFEFGRGQFNCDLIAFGRTSTVRNKKKEGPLSRFSPVVGPVLAQYSLCARSPDRKRPFQRHCGDDMSARTQRTAQTFRKNKMRGNVLNGNVSLERFGRLRKKGF